MSRKNIGCFDSLTLKLKGKGIAGNVPSTSTVQQIFSQQGTVKEESRSTTKPGIVINMVCLCTTTYDRVWNPRRSIAARHHRRNQYIVHVHIPIKKDFSGYNETDVQDNDRQPTQNIGLYSRPTWVHEIGLFNRPGTGQNIGFYSRPDKGQNAPTVKARERRGSNCSVMHWKTRQITRSKQISDVTQYGTDLGRKELQFKAQIVIQFKAQPLRVQRCPKNRGGGKTEEIRSPPGLNTRAQPMAWQPKSCSPGRSPSPQTAGEEVATLSLPNVDPSPEVVERFWKRVAELTARYHDVDNNWTGSPEVKAWNNSHRKAWGSATLSIPSEGTDLAAQACDKCLNSKAQRTCVIDEDHPSCRSCREVKIGCDRKTQFIFDSTREQFFDDYVQFQKVYENRSPGQMRKHKQAVNIFRSSTHSMNSLRTHRGIRKVHGTRACRPEDDTSSDEDKARISEMNIRLQVLSEDLKATKAREAALVRELIQTHKDHANVISHANFLVAAVSPYLASSSRQIHDLGTYIHAIRNGGEKNGPITATAIEIASKLVEGYHSISRSVGAPMGVTMYNPHA
ncbi:hypothetical protein DFH06DRAFT_1127898 [Mycena polygramma]|nr:hypothetical protein DFH06DRAFT_1127898 [Mycena polygramma]